MGIRKLFGLRLRTLREIRGLSREQLAEQIGYSVGTVQQWETSHINVRIDHIEKLAAALKAPAYYFLLPDKEAEAMLYKNDRDQDTTAYQLHQQEIQIGKLEAELRAKTNIIEEYRNQLDAKDNEIAGLRKRYCGQHSNQLEEHSKQMLQLSARLVEIVVGSMLTEERHDSH